MNRKTPKEVIEKGNPKTEQAYVKFPREELIDISKGGNEYSVRSNMKLVREMAKNKLYNRFTHIHTHPYLEGESLCALPSSVDLESFYNQAKEKSSMIAQRDTQTGEIFGYTALLKAKDKNLWSLKELYNSEKIHRKLANYNKKLITGEISPKEAYNELNDICDKEDWRIRFVPAKGYYFNKETGNFEKNKGANLEKVVASIMGVSILLFVLFNVVNINGFVINNSSNVGSINLFWALATILLGITFFVVRRVKKSE